MDISENGTVCVSLIASGEESQILYLDGGEWKQLGKECLKLFVTGIDIDAIATFESFIKEAEDMANPGDEFFYNRRARFVEVQRALELAQVATKMFGFVTIRDNVGDRNVLSTKNIVQAKILKEMGCNGIRCSHNSPAPELLDLCDRTIVMKQGRIVADGSTRHVFGDLALLEECGLEQPCELRMKRALKREYAL